MRGNMDCAQYPRTGHPPMDVESWRKILRIYQSYGFNQIRFHSWCPPEAAFAARLGDVMMHGDTIAPGLGSPNVTIGGKPALRSCAGALAKPPQISTTLPLALPGPPRRSSLLRPVCTSRCPATFRRATWASSTLRLRTAV